MRLKVYRKLDEFMEETFPILVEKELQNNLIIGNCLRAKEFNLDTDNYFLGCIKDDSNNIRIISMMTPPFSLIIYEVNNEPCVEGMKNLINYLHKKYDIKGVIALNETEKRFTKYYTKVIDSKPLLKLKLRLYQLKKLQYRGNTSGFLRKATFDDLYYLPFWNLAFALEDGVTKGYDLNGIINKQKNFIERGYLYVYEDQIPVSMVASARKTINGVIINNVYTPPQYRNRGYATAMVYDLCKILLNDYQYCGLYTDLSNPISNSIYQKIGFTPICDFNEVEYS